MNEPASPRVGDLGAVWSRLVDVICVRPVVAADETRYRIVRDKTGKTKNGFVRTFGARAADGGLDIAYVFVVTTASGEWYERAG